MRRISEKNVWTCDRQNSNCYFSVPPSGYFLIHKTDSGLNGFWVVPLCCKQFQSGRQSLKGNQMIEINTSTPVETDQWRHVVSKSSPIKLLKMNNIFYKIFMVALIMSPLIGLSMFFADVSFTEIHGRNTWDWLFYLLFFRFLVYFL